MESVLTIPTKIYSPLKAHLLADAPNESAAFLFANFSSANGVGSFNVSDWYAVSDDGFATKSPYYLELAESTKAFVIKRSHELGCSLIETHSHPSSRTAKFSPSDRSGFSEFVPHVMWRLKGKPYCAVVFTPDDCDALFWLDPANPEQVSHIRAGRRAIRMSGLSLSEFGVSYVE